MEILNNSLVGRDKTRKIKKVTTSQDDKGRVGASVVIWLVNERVRGEKQWYPTQAKTGLDPDFLPRCVREIHVCAFY